MAWKEIARYRSGCPDGSTEEHVLEKDEKGNFRVRNDFGNTVFEFERMSGYEFFRKVKRDIENDIEKAMIYFNEKNKNVKSKILESIQNIEHDEQEVSYEDEGEGESEGEEEYEEDSDGN